MKYYWVHKLDESVRQGLNNKILVDGPSQEGENIKSNKWTAY